MEDISITSQHHVKDHNDRDDRKEHGRSRKHLQVNQNPLNFGILIQRHTVTLGIVISNSGNQPLAWQGSSEHKDWLTLEPSSGTLEPGAHRTINVTVHAGSLAVDAGVITNYVGILNFTGRVEQHEQLEQRKQHLESEKVYVMVGVRSIPSLPFNGGGPKAPQMSLNLLDFGTVQKGHNPTLPDVITNISDDTPLPWTSNTSGASWVTIQPDHDTLAPISNERVNVTAHTNSLGKGVHFAILTFRGNGGQQQVLAKVTI